MDALAEGFSDLYEIDVSVYRGNSESVLQRVLQEQQAEFHGNDVWEDNTTNLNVANQEGLLATTSPSSATRFAKTASRRTGPPPLHGLRRRLELRPGQGR